MAKVRLSEAARDDFRDLDGSAQRIVAAGLKKLETDPHLRGQPLGRRSGGNLTTFRKLVVGNRTYRIIYQIEPDGTVVVVWVIDKRSDSEAYELAMARLRMHADANIRGLATSLDGRTPAAIAFTIASEAMSVPDSRAPRPVALAPQSAEAVRHVGIAVRANAGRGK